MGALRFGMSPSAVAERIGVPERARARESALREFRDIHVPIVTYEREKLVAIKAFYDVPEVTYQGMNIFDMLGLQIFQALEAANGGALHNVGIVLFTRIGLTCGRLDQDARGDHWITAFSQGLWDTKLVELEPITFLR